jgi:hypothetical protein
MFADALKRFGGALTDYAAWGLGGSFLGCLACGLYMAWYFPGYELASHSDLPFGLSDLYWKIMSSAPEPDVLSWSLWAVGLGFGCGLAAGPRFGRREILYGRTRSNRWTE